MPELYVKDSGAVWRKMRELYIKDSGGTWRTIKELWINQAGTWRKVYANILYPAIDGSGYGSGTGGGGDAALRVQPDGTWDIHTLRPAATAASGSWISPIVGTPGNTHFVKFTNLGSSVTGGGSVTVPSGWQALTAQRVCSATSTPSGATAQVSLRVDIGTAAADASIVSTGFVDLQSDN